MLHSGIDNGISGRLWLDRDIGDETRGNRRAKLLYWAAVLRSIGPLLWVKLRRAGLIALLIDIGRRWIAELSEGARITGRSLPAVHGGATSNHGRPSAPETPRRSRS
jgi:hypothetical protein